MALNDEMSAARRVFPAPGTSLNRLLTDREFRRTFHARLKGSNPFVVAFYRVGLLPLFGAARTVMLLNTRGRKSGKLRSTPIGYWRIGGAVHVISAWGRSARWYRNLAEHPEEVWVQIGMRRWAARPHVLEDPEEIRRTLEQFIRESPEAARYLFGWDPARDQFETADFSPAVERILFVRFDEK